MATVESFTKDRLIQIEESVIVSGSINESGFLELKNRRGDTITAGYVVGPQGERSYGTLAGTFLDLAGGFPRVNLDGVPFPINVHYSVVDVNLLVPMSRVIVLRMDEFYILAGQLGGVVPPQPGRVSDIQTLVNDTSWTRDRGFVATNRSVFSWNPILKDAGGNDVTIQDYQIWSRLPSGNLALDVVVSPEIQNGKIIGEVTHWEPGVTRQIVIYARSSLGRLSEPSVEYTHTPSPPSSEVPDYPRNVQVISNSGIFTNSGPKATIIIEFDPVTVTIDNGPTTVKEYSLLVNELEFARTRNSPFTIEYDSGKTFSLRVVAHSVSGISGDPSPEIIITPDTPTVLQLKPSEPVLKSDRGVMTASWDGLYTTAPDLSAGRVDVEARVSGTTSWVVQGSLNQKGEQLIFIGEIGNDIQVRLTAYDKLGRLMLSSDISTLKLVGVDVPPIDPQIITDINLAKTKAQEAYDNAGTAVLSANNAMSAAEQAVSSVSTVDKKITVSSSAPSETGGYPEGSIWERRSGSKIISRHVLIGNEWTEVKIDGSQLQTRTLNANLFIEGTITAASGVLAEASVGSGNIIDLTVDKLRVTGGAQFPVAVVNTLVSNDAYLKNAYLERAIITASPHNLVPNGSGEYGDIGGWTPVGLTWDPDDKPGGLSGSFASPKGSSSMQPPSVWMNVEPGEYIFEVWIKADVPNSLLYMSIVDQDNNRESISHYAIPGLESGGDTGQNNPAPNYSISRKKVPTEWLKITNRMVVSETVSKIRIGAVLYNHHYGSERNAEIKIAGMRIFRPVRGELIVDGSITADKVFFNDGWFNKMYGNEASIGKIETQHLSSGVGASLSLTANESIILMVENLEQTNANVSEVSDGVSSVSEGLDIATLRIDELGDDLSSTTLVADSALSAAVEAKEKVDRLDSYIVIDNQGLGIYSKKDSQNHIKVGFDTISIVNQGSVASYWDATKLVSNQIETNSLQFGPNHIAESMSGRTVFRAI